MHSVTSPIFQTYCIPIPEGETPSTLQEVQCIHVALLCSTSLSFLFLQFVNFYSSLFQQNNISQGN